MYIVLTTVMVLSALTGICCTACLLYSYLLRPYTTQGTWAVVWGFGGGEGLEQRVRSLVWLQSCGLLRCNLVLADVSLDERGRALAVRLAGRYPGLTLCTRQELERRLKDE